MAARKYIRPTRDEPPANRARAGRLPLASLVRIGLWTGLFGILIIILWSGSSAIMAGLLAGVICGFVASGRATDETPMQTVRARRSSRRSSPG